MREPHIDGSVLAALQGERPRVPALRREVDPDPHRRLGPEPTTGGEELVMARCRRAERWNDVAFTERLDEIREDARGNRLVDVGTVAERSEHHDRDRALGVYPPRGL